MLEIHWLIYSISLSPHNLLIAKYWNQIKIRRYLCHEMLILYRVHFEKAIVTRISIRTPSKGKCLLVCNENRFLLRGHFSSLKCFYLKKMIGVAFTIRQFASEPFKNFFLQHCKKSTFCPDKGLVVLRWTTFPLIDLALSIHFLAINVHF